MKSPLIQIYTQNTMPSNNLRSPLISCVIPTKNRHKLARRAVESVLKQTFTDLEVIVVDDNSSPPFSMPDERADPRVKIITSNVYLGGAKARNIGIESSHGDYLCFLDDDDFLLENKLELMTAILQNNPTLDVVGADVIMTNLSTGERTVTTHDFSITKNTCHNRIHTNATLIRRSSLGDIRFFEKLEKFQDTQFNTELFFKLRSLYLAQPVAIWHTNVNYGQITSIKKPFFNTRNYFKLIVYLRQHVRVPYRFMYFHIFMLLSFLARGK